MKKKSNLDEAQEQKLLKIEHNGYQIAYWGLLAAILIQTALMPGNLLALAGEWIVFMAMCIYMIAACLKNGIWDRKFKPNAKANLTLSLIASLLFGLYWLATSYYRYGKLLGCFALIFGNLTLCTKLYQKRVKKMEENMEE